MPVQVIKRKPFGGMADIASGFLGGYLEGQQEQEAKKLEEQQRRILQGFIDPQGNYQPSLREQWQMQEQNTLARAKAVEDERDIQDYLKWGAQLKKLDELEKQGLLVPGQRQAVEPDLKLRRSLFEQEHGLREAAQGAKPTPPKIITHLGADNKMHQYRQCLSPEGVWQEEDLGIMDLPAMTIESAYNEIYKFMEENPQTEVGGKEGGWRGVREWEDLSEGEKATYAMGLAQERMAAYEAAMAQAQPQGAAGQPAPQAAPAAPAPTSDTEWRENAAIITEGLQRLGLMPGGQGQQPGAQPSPQAPPPAALKPLTPEAVRASKAAGCKTKEESRQWLEERGYSTEGL